MMTTSAHGSKYTCSNCNAKFYDVKGDGVCPKCEFKVVTQVKLSVAPSYADIKKLRQQAIHKRLADKRTHKASLGNPDNA